MLSLDADELKYLLMGQGLMQEGVAAQILSSITDCHALCYKAVMLLFFFLQMRQSTC
jgi:hypothetical protein